MVCRFICRIIVVGLMGATFALATDIAPPAVSRRVEAVQERVGSRVPPRLERAHDKVIAHLERLKDRFLN
jgi:hypothetical protein